MIYRIGIALMLLIQVQCFEPTEPDKTSLMFKMKLFSAAKDMAAGKVLSIESGFAYTQQISISGRKDNNEADSEVFDEKSIFNLRDGSTAGTKPAVSLLTGNYREGTLIVSFDVDKKLPIEITGAYLANNNEHEVIFKFSPEFHLIAVDTVKFTLVKGKASTSNINLSAERIMKNITVTDLDSALYNADNNIVISPQVNTDLYNKVFIDFNKSVSLIFN